MLEICDFTRRFCDVNRVCGCLVSSESFSSASQACITRTPTAAPGLLGLRREGQPLSAFRIGEDTARISKDLMGNVPRRRLLSEVQPFWFNKVKVCQVEAADVKMGDLQFLAYWS